MLSKEDVSVHALMCGCSSLGLLWNELDVNIKMEESLKSQLPRAQWNAWHPVSGAGFPFLPSAQYV